MNIHVNELEWIKQLHNILRTSSMDTFFILWNYVDSFSFFIIFLGITWFIINRRIGIFTFYVFLLSSIVNPLLKNLFNLPRPSQIDPSVGVLNLSSPGFPSGAAQTAAIIAGIIIMNTKNRLYQCGGLLFACLLCFSRVYLGLHFFSDIIGGLFVGSLLLTISWLLAPWIEQNEKKCMFLFPLLLLLFFQSKFVIQSGLSFGIAIGLLLTKYSSDEGKSWYIGFGKALSAILGVLVIFEVKDYFPSYKFFFAFVGGFWFSYFSAFLIQKVQLFSRKAFG